MNAPPIETMPYRKGANALLFNNEGEVFIVQKTSYNDNEWDLPGGGLEDNETAEEGVLRELLEELGTSKFKVLYEGKNPYRFEWPQDVIERGFSKRNKWYRGQEKSQFVIEFLGNKEEIKLQEEEIRDSKWVLPEDLDQYLVFTNQYAVVKALIDEYKSQN